MTRTKNTFLWWNLLFFVATIAVNGLAQLLPLGGKSTGEISDKHHTLITPAGYAFTIWIVIYISLTGFIVFLLLESMNETKDSVVPLAFLFILSCIFNIAWILLWQYQYITFSLVAMILLLITLALLYHRTQRITLPTKGERWFIMLPISLYFGWICVATLINIHVVLFHTGIKNNFILNEAMTGIILLIIGTIAALIISYRFLNGIIPVIFLWGFAAIAAEQKGHPDVFLAASLLAIILFVYAIWITFMRASERD